MNLIIHPGHPGALAVMGEDGGPVFVSAERVLAHVRDLERQVAELTDRYSRLFEACENLSTQNGRVELRQTGEHTHVWLPRYGTRFGVAMDWECAGCGEVKAGSNG